MNTQIDLDEENRSIEIVDKLRMELRRGALPLAVLAQLRQEHYGYSLRKRLNEQGLDIDEGTLYPLIRRLDKQGLLNSELRDDQKRKKRYYRLSTLGESVLILLTAQWRAINKNIDGILGEE